MYFGQCSARRIQAWLTRWLFARRELQDGVVTMPRKTRQEARAERITWFLMILVFILYSFDTGATIPTYVVPIILSIILVGSGLYQYAKKWRVSPVVWIVGVILGIVGAYGVYFTRPIFDPTLAAFIGTVLVILMGVISNES